MLKGAQGGGQGMPGGRGMPGGQAGQQAPTPQRPRAGERVGHEGRKKNPYDDLFGEMFETGSKQRDEYQKGIESIFDQFSRGMDRHR